MDLERQIVVQAIQYATHTHKNEGKAIRYSVRTGWRMMILLISLNSFQSSSLQENILNIFILVMGIILDSMSKLWINIKLLNTIELAVTYNTTWQKTIVTAPKCLPPPYYYKYYPYIYLTAPSFHCYLCLSVSKSKSVDRIFFLISSFTIQCIWYFIKMLHIHKYEQQCFQYLFYF